ncbi:MAG TPA: hypothetical protein VEP71_04435, partial [Gallionella sp.]|nr:hypothetical protein [Gallionella sp.]
VIRQAEMLKDLGVKPTKQLSQNLIDSAQGETSADSIRKVNKEASQAEISSRKISDHFARIESVELLEGLENNDK